MFKLRFTVDTPELKKRTTKAAGEGLAPLAAVVLADLKRETPVDTGEARDSWSVDYGVVNGQHTFTATNSAEHIIYLNAGHSDQAPAYFIESVALRYGKASGRVVEAD